MFADLFVVCYTAVFRVVTQCSSPDLFVDMWFFDDSKNAFKKTTKFYAKWPLLATSDKNTNLTEYLRKKKSSVKLGIQILYAVDQFTSLFSR